MKFNFRKLKEAILEVNNRIYPYKEAFKMNRNNSSTDVNEQRGYLKTAYWIYLKYWRSRSPDNMNAEPIITYSEFANNYTVSSLKSFKLNGYFQISNAFRSWYGICGAVVNTVQD